MSSLKFADGGIVEGIAAPNGSPARRDAHGEFFTDRTNFQLDWFAERPLIIGHGLGPSAAAVVGKVVTVERRPEGLWIRAQLDKASAWFGKIRGMLESGALSFSSATMPHLAKVTPSGEITDWPLVEVSLTDSPASRDARITNVREAAAHYQAIGAPVAAFKAYLVPLTPEELAYKSIAAEVDAIELRRAAAEEFARYIATSADLDRRYGPARRR